MEQSQSTQNKFHVGHSCSSEINNYEYNKSTFISCHKILGQ